MIRRALGLFLVATMALHATTVQPMSVERLTRASQLIVHARAADSWSAWDEGGTLIYTYTRFQVLSTWKGGATSQVVVKQLGGRAGHYTQKVAGLRGWRKGEEAVLFLSASKQSSAAMIVTGLMQGDFRFVPGADRVLSNGVPGVEAYDSTSRKISAYRGAQLRYTDLAARVRQAVQQ